METTIQSIVHMNMSDLLCLWVFIQKVIMPWWSAKWDYYSSLIYHTIKECVLEDYKQAAPCHLNVSSMTDTPIQQAEHAKYLE